MDYTPRHSQPFTVAEAIGFDVSVIIEEMNRLEISLKKLRETQEFLQSFLEATPDAEIAQVLEENKLIIESQEERIIILKLALIERGILSAAHYRDETTTWRPSQASHNQGQLPDTGSHTIQTPPSEPPRQIETEGGDHGVYL